MCTSLADLRAQGVLPTADEARGSLTEEQEANRRAALTALEASRNADAAQRLARKREREKALRLKDASRYAAEEEMEGGGGRSGGTRPALSEDVKRRILAHPRACRHFFGLPPPGVSLAPGATPPACTRGDKCRFLHDLDAILSGSG